MYVATQLCILICLSVYPELGKNIVYVCTSVRLYVCTSARLYVCTSVRLYVCTFVRLYVCMSMKIK